MDVGIRLKADGSGLVGEFRIGAEQLQRLSREAANTEREFGKLSREAEKLRRGHADAADGAAKHATALQKLGADMGKLIGVGIGTGITGVAAYLAYQTKVSIDAAAALDTLAIKTGISVAQLSRLKYAAEQSNTTIDTLARAMRQLPKSIIEAQAKGSESARAFGFLEINPAQLKTQEEAIDAIANAIQRVEDPMARSVALSMIFKRNGEELLPFFAKGAEGIRKLGEEGKRFAEYTALDAQRADELKNRLHTMNLAAGEAGKVFAADLVPRLNDMAEAFLKNASAGHKLLGVFAGIRAFWSGSGEVRGNRDFTATVSNMWLAQNDVDTARRIGNPVALRNAQRRYDALAAQANAMMAERQSVLPPVPGTSQGKIRGGAETLAGESEAQKKAREEEEKRAAARQQALTEAIISEPYGASSEGMREWAAHLGKTDMEWLTRQERVATESHKQAMEERAADNTAYWEDYARRYNEGTGKLVEFGAKNEDLSVALITDGDARARAMLAIERHRAQESIDASDYEVEQRQALTERLSEWYVLRQQQLAEELKPQWQKLVEGYADATRLMREATDRVVTATVRAGEDMVVNWRKTGRLSGKGLADAFVDEVVRTIYRATYAGPIAAAAKAVADTLLEALGAGKAPAGIREWFGNLFGGGSGIVGGSGAFDSYALSVMGAAGGGVIGPRGSMPLARYAGGGIADVPQLAVFGEGSMPEAYVPLPDGRRIPVQIRGSGATVHAPLNVSIDARGAGPGAAEAIRAMVRQAFPGLLYEHRRNLEGLMRGQARERGR